MNVREKFWEIKFAYENRIALIDTSKRQLDLTLKFNGSSIDKLHKLILVRTRHSQAYNSISMMDEHLLALTANDEQQEHYFSDAQMDGLTFYLEVSDYASYSGPVKPVDFAILEQNLPVRKPKSIKVSVDGEFVCEVNSYDCNHSTEIFDILNISSSITDTFPKEISKFFSDSRVFNDRLVRAEIVPDKSINFVTRMGTCGE